MAENIVTGRKYRILTDAAQQLWDRVSFWSKASDTEYNDGKDAETKNGAINGITSDVNGEATDVAASIKVVHDLNDSLGGLKFAQDGEGNWGFIPSGADAVIPFSGTPVPLILYYVSGTNTSQGYDYIAKSHFSGVSNITIDNDFINITNKILTAKRNIMLTYANHTNTAENVVIKRGNTHTLSISAYTSIMAI